MLSFVVAILALALAISPASAAVFDGPAQDSTPATYVALGDSIAFGIGSSLPRIRGYPAILQQLLTAHMGSEVKLANMAVPGETAATFLASGQADAFRDFTTTLAGRPIDLVTVTLGGNEMLALRSSDTETRRSALDAFRSNIQTVASVIRELAGNDAILVFTTYYDLLSGDEAEQESDAWWIEQFNQAIREAAGTYQATVAEVGQVFDDQIDSLTHYPHDVHPNNEGYLTIAEVLWAALQIDREEPKIIVLSEETSARPTPTLQLRVTDDTEVANVVVTVDGKAMKPHFVGDDTYVLLLNLQSADGEALDLTLEANDLAGNATRLDHRVVFSPLLVEHR